METKYLCSSWEGLIQEIVLLAGKGYYNYHIVKPNIKKLDRWPHIDNKLIKKYQTTLTKSQRNTRKKKKQATFRYLRWENIAVIMHTSGNIADTITYDDKFFDIRRKPIKIIISELIEVSIYRESKKSFSLKLTDDSFENIKTLLSNAVSSGYKKNIISSFKLVNAIPPYKGIIRQKRKLVKFIAYSVKLHKLVFSTEILPFKDKRSSITVFEQD